MSPYKLARLVEHTGTALVPSSSPIQCLPHDILRRIFLKAHPGRSVDYLASPFVEFPAPDDDFALVLSAVCRSWRTVALSISPYWSTIPLIFSRSYAPALVETYLTRTFMQELVIETVVKEGRSFAVDEEVAVGSALMRVLLPHIARWHTLTLRPTHPETVQAMLSLVRGTAPSLVNLEVGSCCGTRSVRYAATYIIPPTFCAPNIKNVNIYKYPHYWAGADSLGGAASLETLSIQPYEESESRSFVALRPILSSLRHLRHLTLTKYGVCDSRLPWVEELLHLECLEHLTWWDVRGKCLLEFFSTVKAPKLKQMTFASGNRTYEGFDWNYDHNVLRERFPALHHFNILDSNVVATEIIISSLFITSLSLFMGDAKLESNALDDQIFVAMGRFGHYVHTGANWLCPRLEFLEVSGNTADTSVTLRPMVEARLNASLSGLPNSPRAIKGLRVICTSLPEADREWLSQNVRDFTML